RLRPVPPEPAPRTPPLPLFPYTTLFRSNRSSLGGGSTDAPGCGVRTGVFISGNTAPHVAHISAAAKVRNFEAIRDMTHGALATEDRKSTRLNSSHVKISYAVFCLKKKKK